MVDLKDRINKPRILRGTPSYAFVNKVSLYALVASTIVSVGLGYVLWFREKKRPEYDPTMTFQKLQIQFEAERYQRYSQQMRDYAEEFESVEKDKEDRPFTRNL